MNMHMRVGWHKWVFRFSSLVIWLGDSYEICPIRIMCNRLVSMNLLMKVGRVKYMSYVRLYFVRRLANLAYLA